MGWRLVGAGFSAVWSLFWIGWTADIYLSDDVFVLPFVELALAAPLLVGVAFALAAKAARRLRPKSRRP